MLLGLFVCSSCWSDSYEGTGTILMLGKGTTQHVILVHSLKKKACHPCSTMVGCVDMGRLCLKMGFQSP